MELLKGIYGKFCKRKNNYWKLQKKFSFIIYLFILIMVIYSGTESIFCLDIKQQLSDIVDLSPNSDFHDFFFIVI